MKVAAASAALACAVLLGACNRQDDRDLVAAARTSIAKKDMRGAVVALKAALQQNPQSGEARLLLGESLLTGGDAATALVELRKAEELKVDAARLTPLLARAMLANGQERKLVDAYAQTSLADAAAQAELQTALAGAYARLQRPEQRDAAIAAALAVVPQHGGARMLRAGVLAERRDFDAALKLLGEVVAADPSNADAWMLEGDILRRGKGDKAGALAALRKAAQARPQMMSAHEQVVGLLVQAGDLDAAAAHVEGLKKLLPKHPGTHFLEAQIAYLKGDYAAVRRLTQPLLQSAPNEPTLLQLAGAAEYQLRALPQAENLLAQALQHAPGLPLARRLLARAQLRTGQPEKALATLAPSLAEAQPAPEALLAAGEAQLLLGDNQRAEGYFARASKLRPDDPRARTALALSHLSKGDGSTAMAELESASKAEQQGSTASLALIAAYLQRNDFDRALKAIDALERKQPDQPLASNLRGRVQLLRGDAAAARASFERALALDPVYFPAAASLAALDVADKRFDAARQRLDALLKVDPRNQRALLALANVLARAGAPPAQVLAQLQAAIRNDPNDTAARLELTGYHLGSGNAKAAALAAQEAVTAQPTSLPLLRALGQAQLAAGDMQQALTTFSRLAALQPKSPLPQLGLAEAHNGVKDYAAAERSLRRALELSPNLLPAQRALVALMIGDRRQDEALAIARSVQTQRPADAAGWLLEGDIERDRRNWDPALAAYRRALQKNRASPQAVLLHTVLVQSGRRDDADRFATEWQREHSQDAAFSYHLGDVALAASDWALAETRYRDVLRVKPEHALALNNIAWLLLKQNKPGALEQAQKASELQPQIPAIRDTLALALAADKQVPKALRMQKETVELAPDDPSFRLTLARLYLQSGDKQPARTELEKLSRLGKRFPDQAEVARLLATL